MFMNLIFIYFLKTGKHLWERGTKWNEYSSFIKICIFGKGSVSYQDISVVLILWLYDIYRILHFSYTILQMIHFCLNLGYFGH